MTVKLNKFITSTLKEYGKATTQEELLEVILAQWDDEIDTDGDQQSRIELFNHNVEDLLESGRIRILRSGSGKKRCLEYVKKSKRGQGHDTSSAESHPSKLQKTTEEPENPSQEVTNTADAAVAASSSSSSPSAKNAYPKQQKPTGTNTILLFYAYATPVMSRERHDEAIAHFYNFLKNLGITGRLRIGREGFNATLTGPHSAVRQFTAELRRWDHSIFGKTDFKYVDDQPDSQLLPTLKVFPVTEIVTYGFKPEEAPLQMGGVHLKPKEFHKALADKNSIVIDVRNFNETAIGKFQPPENAEHTKYIDPCMRRSTEFPQFVDENKESWKGKQVLMYCTAGVRCERASAFMRNRGVENVYQLDGGIHRYLEEFSEDGGYWKGKNYTFDKRYSHGAEKSEVISQCVYCDKPWDRYNAHQKCFSCKMEILLCNECQRRKPALKKSDLFCPLCLPKNK